MSNKYKHLNKNEKLNILSNVLNSPGDYLNDENLSSLANALMVKEESKKPDLISLKKQLGEYKVFGKQFISENTIKQMEQIMMLPISVKGALMPDAHEGYGLPIGGVLAADNTVMPYGVGQDIGCRMSLTLFDGGEDFLKRYDYQIKMALKEKTCFGIGDKHSFNYDHEILERSEFKEFSLANGLHGKARRQLGTSGSGNHFVELGIAEMKKDNIINVDEGKYVAILSHSGSRGFGAEISKYYTKLALQTCRLPKGYTHLAWLDMDTEAGQEYWILMHLAGDYAKACHDLIHKAISKDLGLKEIGRVENHHNFAWKEKLGDGKEYIIHRKGATPAGKDVAGIIPASMATPGYIVRGKGEESSLLSASHGAGRKMSRKKARESFTKSELKKLLKQNKISLIDGGVEESPFAYKNIEDVMMAQRSLVEIEGSFMPKIVRMNKG